MKKVIYLTIILTICTSFPQDIKIFQKIYSYLPQLKQNYSITNTFIYPQQIYRYQFHSQQQQIIPVINQKNNKINVKKNQNHNGFSSQIKYPSSHIFSKPSVFEQFHKISFKASVKNKLVNVDDRSVLNEIGQIINLQQKQTQILKQLTTKQQKIIPQSHNQNPKEQIILKKATKLIQFIDTPPPTQQKQLTQQKQYTQQKQSTIEQKQPTQPTIEQKQLTIEQKQPTIEQKQPTQQKQPPIEQKHVKPNKMLRKNSNIFQQEISIKILFSILLLISMVVVVFFYKPEDQKTTSSIPKHDEEEKQLK